MVDKPSLEPLVETRHDRDPDEEKRCSHRSSQSLACGHHSPAQPRNSFSRYRADHEQRKRRSQPEEPHGEYDIDELSALTGKHALAEDESRTVRSFARQMVVAATLGTSVSCAVLLATMGMRPDLGDAFAFWHAPLKIAFASVLAIAGWSACVRAAHPEARPSDHLLPLLIAPGMLLAGVALELASTPSTQWRRAALGTHPELCVAVVPLLALVPFVAMSLVMRHGAPASRGVAGALTGVSAGAMGAAAYMLRCTDDSPLFVATWYCLAIGMVALAGYLSGIRLYRW